MDCVQEPTFDPALAAGNLLRWHKLTGPEFEEAVQGGLDSNYRVTTPAWLQSPKLHYYRQRSCLVRSDDTRVFFMATLPISDDDGNGSPTRVAVGLLEVDFEYQSNDTVGIKYVTVHESCRQRGIARKLYQMLIDHLKTHQLKLYRTQPGKNTPASFTAAITNMLTSQEVPWTCRSY